jgi:hypothetical protein
MAKTFRMTSGCSHGRTEFVYRQQGIDYVRCLDCGQVLEAEDLESIVAYDDEENN